MDAWHTLVLAGAVVGFGVTLAGLFAAYRAARREAREAGARVDTMRALGDAERAEASERAAIQPETEDQEAQIRATAAERGEFWTAEYSRHDLVRPTYDNMVYLAAYESRRLLTLLLSSTRRELIVAASGLTLSTLAAVASVLLGD